MGRRLDRLDLLVVTFVAACSSPGAPTAPETRRADAEAPEPAVTTAPSTSATSPPPAAAMSPIARCCAAIAQNPPGAPPSQRAPYTRAREACERLRDAPSAPPALAEIRAALAGAAVPAACR